jgi:hypothetical protein
MTYRTRVLILAALTTTVACRQVVGPRGGQTQNLGTVIGTVLKYAPTGDYPGVNIDVRLANSSNPVKTTQYRARTNSAGQYLIQAPAGTYDVYACNVGANGSYSGPYGAGSATVIGGYATAVPDIEMGLNGFPCVTP